MKLIATGFCLIAATLTAIAWAAGEAGLVTVRGIHLSCDSCVADSEASLKDISGVSETKADLSGRSLTFKAKDETTAQAGIKALAKAGFFGRAAFGTKDLAFPDLGIKKGEKRDSITFYGIHLSCGACRKSVHEALTKLDGLSTMEIDPAERTVKLAGAGIVVQDAAELLRKAGFQPTLKAPEKK